MLRDLLTKVLHSKLAVKILLSMVFRLSIVVIVTILLSYLYLFGLLEERAKNNLAKYSAIRSEREQSVFDRAEINQQTLNEIFLFQMRTQSADQARRYFDQFLEKRPDGSFRSRKTKLQNGVAPKVFVGQNVRLTPELIKKIAVAHQVLREVGAAFHTRFRATYFSFPEKVVVRISDDVDGESEVSFSEAAVQNQSYGKSDQTSWSRGRFDTVTEEWVVGASRPILNNEQYLGSSHQDLTLSDLLSRTSENNLVGTYSYVLRADGSPIGRSESKIADPILAEQQQKFLSKLPTKNVEVLRSANGLIAYAPIQGPNWYLVSVYPKSVLSATASSSLLFTVLLGGLSLAVELAIVYFVLRNHVTLPLKNLVSAARRLAKGNFSVEIDTSGRDEFGDFARAFAVMKHAIAGRDRALESHNRNLETLVADRTKELEIERLHKIQASKMATLGEMAGGIAHEINTPLASIQIRANQIQEIAEKGEVDLNFYMECAQSIDRTVQRVSRIIKGLRQFSRDGSQEAFEQADAKTIVQDTLDLASERLRHRGIQLRVTVPDELTFDCRAVQLSQVLLNLLNNACDALENQSEKWIKIDARETQEKMIEISVTDSGPGVPAELAEKIMLPFFTTKNAAMGTGLGLSISRSILLEHNGELLLDRSAIHTKFILRLPRYQGQTSNIAA